jgi:MFS family permease
MTVTAPSQSVQRQFDSAYGRRVLMILAVMALMVTYVETMVLPAFSNFESFFGVTEASTIAWILSAYLLVGVVVTPIFGKLGDIYGKKRMLLTAMLVYAVAVSLAGFSPNIGSAFGLSRPDQIYLLIGVRAVQGVGMAMFPLGFAMLPEVFPPARVGQAQGLLSGMFAAGAALGLVGGGWIAQNYGWQLTYHTVIPVAALVIVLAFVFVKESQIRLTRKIDLPGVISLGAGLTLLMLGITEGAYWGWGDFSAVKFHGIPWGVPEFFILSLVAFGYFLYWEPRAPSPVVSFASLKERNIAVSNVNGVIVGMAMFLLFTILIILGEYPSPGFGLSELDAGLVLVPAVISMLVTGPFLGRTISARGPKPVMILGFALIVVGAFGLAAFHSSTYEVGAISIPIMVGNVAVLISMSNVIVLSVDPKTMGIQTGMNQTFRNLGSALGPVLVTSILTSYAFTESFGPTVFQNYHAEGYEVVFGLVGVIGLVGLLCSVALRNFRYSADGRRSGHPGETTTAQEPPQVVAPTQQTPLSAANPQAAPPLRQTEDSQ